MVKQALLAIVLCGPVILGATACGSPDELPTDLDGLPDSSDAQPDMTAPDATEIEDVSAPSADLFVPDPAIRDVERPSDADEQADVPAPPAPDVAEDTSSEELVEPEPVVCSASEACNARLADGGSCPGDCVPQSPGLLCPGATAFGLCVDGPLPTTAELFNLPSGLKGSFTMLPDLVTVEDVVVVEFSITNPGAVAGTVALEAKPSAGAWTLEQTSFAQAESITVAPGETVALTMTLRPFRATVFEVSSWTAGWLMVNNSQIVIRVPAGFGDTEPVVCGAYTFPETWCAFGNCTVDGKWYFQAQCCEDIFYPGAQCCTHSDCADGRCFDGQCVTSVPASPWGTTPLVGVQHIGVVVADLPVDGDFDLCENAWDTAPEAVDAALGLSWIEGWFVQKAMTRTLTSAVSFHWHVTVVADSASFVTDDNYTPDAWMAALEAALIESACIDGFAADFDRMLFISPKLELGRVARVVAVDRAAAISAWPRSLVAHELGHLYGGATDLYLTAGGKLHYRTALMSNGDISGLPPGTLPSDAVLWAQSGLGDVDSDGVIDAFVFPVNPVALAFGDVTLTVLSDRVEVATTWVAEEADGTLLPLRPTDLAVTLNGTPASAVSYGVATFLVDPATLPEEVSVTASARYRYTRPDLTRELLEAQTTQTITLAK